MKIISVAVGSALCLGLGLWVSHASPAFAKTQVTANTIQEVDPQTAKDLLATFEQAEQAMQAQDLDGIMALYSDDYYYHGLKKADIRKVWAQLFEHYKDLESFHKIGRAHV